MLKNEASLNAKLIYGFNFSQIVTTHLLGAVLDGGELLLLLPELGVLALQHLLLLRQRRREVEEHHLRQDLGSLILSLFVMVCLVSKASLSATEVLVL